MIGHRESFNMLCWNFFIRNLRLDLRVFEGFQIWASCAHRLSGHDLPYSSGKTTGDPVSKVPGQDSKGPFIGSIKSTEVL